LEYPALSTFSLDGRYTRLSMHISVYFV
jgi:hypothetical protein